MGISPTGFDSHTRTTRTRLAWLAKVRACYSNIAYIRSPLLSKQTNVKSNKRLPWVRVYAACLSRYLCTQQNNSRSTYGLRLKGSFQVWLLESFVAWKGAGFENHGCTQTHTSSIKGTWTKTETGPHSTPIKPLNLEGVVSQGAATSRVTVGNCSRTSRSTSWKFRHLGL